MIRVAVVGYGYWGPRLTRTFSKVAGCELAAVCEPALHTAGERTAGR